jgi:hypothetical protein
LNENNENIEYFDDLKGSYPKKSTGNISRTEANFFRNCESNENENIPPNSNDGGPFDNEEVFEENERFVEDENNQENYYEDDD